MSLCNQATSRGGIVEQYHTASFLHLIVPMAIDLLLGDTCSTMENDVIILPPSPLTSSLFDPFQKHSTR